MARLRSGPPCVTRYPTRTSSFSDEQPSRHPLSDKILKEHLAPGSVHEEAMASLCFLMLPYASSFLPACGSGCDEPPPCTCPTPGPAHQAHLTKQGQILPHRAIGR